MGRCPLAIPLAVIITIIILSDCFGLRKPQEPPLLGYQVCCANINEIYESQTAGRLAIAEIDSVNGVKVLPFKAQLHFLDETPLLTAGQSVKFGTDLSQLNPPVNIPDAVDLQANLRNIGVTARAVIDNDSVHYVHNTPGIYALLRRANAAATDFLHSLPLSNLSIEMLSAMLLGNGEYLTHDRREIFSASGLSHILALSGMHVGVIGLIISLMLWPLYFSRHLRTRLLLSIIALWVYAAFTGFIPSVTRAVIMASVYLGGRILQRRSVSLNSLCSAAILILIVSPSDLYSVGFQLSFAAVAGIIVWFPLINRVNRRNHPWLYMLISIPTLSISAMIFSGVISALHFHQFPLLFLLSNIVITPLIPLFIISGVVSMIFSVSEPTNFFASAIDHVANFTASFPFANLNNLYPPVWYVIALCSLLFILGLAIHYKHRFVIYESALLIIGITFFNIFLPKNQYPLQEAYLIEHSSGNVIIERIDNQCRLYSPLKAAAERTAQKEYYELILQDFLALRNVDSLQVIPFDTSPVCLIEGKSVTLQK